MTRRALALSQLAVGALLLGGTPALAAATSSPGLGTATVGRQPDGSVVTSTGQRLTPTGTQVEFPGRVTQIALRPDDRTATLLLSQGGPLAVVDLATARVIQTVGSGAGSFDGLAYSHHGDRLFASMGGGAILDMAVAADGTLTQRASISTPRVTPNPASIDINSGSNNAYPGGLAFSADDARVYVVLSVLNSVAVIDVASDKINGQIPVGNAPHSIVVSGTTAFVSNEGGRPATATDTTNNSDGTAIVSDPVHGSAATGTVNVVDLTAGKEVATVAVGLHPTALALSGSALYVANTNSDTISLVDMSTRRVQSTISVTPFPGAPYGAQPTGIVPLADGRLAVTLGRSNALALVGPATAAGPAALLGLIPTGAYPSAVVQDVARNQLIVTNDKGVGNLGPTAAGGDGTGHATGSAYVGSLSLFPTPTTTALAAGTSQVRADNGWDTLDTACPRGDVAPKAVPDHVGEPSTIKHIIYVAKENRTYDQVLGDDPRGNGDSKLTQFDSRTTPNQHALVKQFPLVDNFYDSGQLSADGHQWFVQGGAPDYLEKSFGSFTRSYPSQAGDALAYLPSGFIWENALRHGKTVVDYGEYASSAGKGLTSTDVPSLQPLVRPSYPGFDLTIPDAFRMQVFLKDFNGWVSSAVMPDLVMMSLPQDHTTAYVPSYPSADAMVADNDQALGTLVQAVSRSPFWKDTAILVEEDDSQNGLDHVDAHRSVFYAISPYARHGGYVDHTYYNQVNALRTVEQILGLPPMNTLDLAAIPMRSLFTDEPDLAPYAALVPAASTAGVNPPLVALSGVAREWAMASQQMDLTRPDAVEPAVLNHAVWYAGHGFSTPYPGEARVLHPAEVAAGRINLPVGGGSSERRLDSDGSGPTDAAGGVPVHPLDVRTAAACTAAAGGPPPAAGTSGTASGSKAAVKRAIRHDRRPAARPAAKAVARRPVVQATRTLAFTGVTVGLQVAGALLLLVGILGLRGAGTRSHPRTRT